MNVSVDIFMSRAMLVGVRPVVLHRQISPSHSLSSLLVSLNRKLHDVTFPDFINPNNSKSCLFKNDAFRE
jgi:hypothetical protein